MRRLNDETCYRLEVGSLEGMQSARIETLSGTPEQFAGSIKLEIARWARVVKEANLSVE